MDITLAPTTDNTSPYCRPAIAAWRFLAWLASASCLASAIWHCGQQQFGAFDDSLILDVAWRMANDQKPYTDFYMPLSPEFYLGAKHAFHYAGAHWSSLVLAATVMSIATFGLTTFVLKRVVPFWRALFLATACQAMAMVIPSYWWYNANVSAASCLAFATTFALIAAPPCMLLSLVLTLSFSMLMLMKVNIAALTLLCCVMTLASARRTRVLAIVAVACAAMIAVAVLLCHSIDPRDVLASYAGMAGTRGFPGWSYLYGGKPNEIFASLPLLVALVFSAVMCGLQPAPLRQDAARPTFTRVASLVCAGTLVGVYAIFASTDMSLITGLPVVCLCCMLFIFWAVNHGGCPDRMPPTLALGVGAVAIASVPGIILFHWLPITPLAAGIRNWPACVPLYLWIALTLGGGVAMAAAAGSFFLQTMAISPHGESAACRAAVPHDGGICASANGGQRFGVWLALCDWHSQRAGKACTWTTLATCLVAVCVCTASYASVSRVRVMINGVDLFWTRDSLVLSDLPLFSGKKTSASFKAVGGEMRDIINLLREKGYAANGVFFGIRLEFGYAAFGLQSPKGLPVWWDPKAAFPPYALSRIVDRFREHRFAACIFWKLNGRDPELTFMPDGVRAELAQNYTLLDTPLLYVFVRKPIADALQGKD